LKPGWLGKISKRGELINVRAETLRDRRTFRSDLAERRCLVPADGFYEWKTLPNGKKVPFRIVRKDGQPFAFAGIWEENKNGMPENRFAIITTEANDLMEHIHARMPVILEKDHETLWLDQNVEIREILSMLRPAPSQDLKAYRVSSMVNRGTVDAPKIVAPVA
jgi:putative SOS response-associated peptidase YedK